MELTHLLILGSAYLIGSRLVHRVLTGASNETDAAHQKKSPRKRIGRLSEKKPITGSLTRTKIS